MKRLDWQPRGRSISAKYGQNYDDDDDDDDDDCEFDDDAFIAVHMCNISVGFSLMIIFLLMVAAIKFDPNPPKIFPASLRNQCENMVYPSWTKSANCLTMYDDK